MAAQKSRQHPLLAVFALQRASPVCWILQNNSDILIQKGQKKRCGRAEITSSIRAEVPLTNGGGIRF